MQFYIKDLEIVFNPVHKGPLIPLKEYDPTGQESKFIGPTRVRKLQQTIETIAKYLHSNSEFLFSGGVGIALTLQALGEKARQFLPRPPLVTSINGFYRDHQAIRVACLEDDFEDIVNAARQYNYFPYKSKMAKIPFTEKKSDIFIPLKTEEASKSENIRLIRRPHKVIEKLIEIDDYIDIFLHHYETADGQRVRKQTTKLNNRFTKLYRNAKTQQVVCEEDLWIASNEDGIRVPADKYRGYTIKPTQFGVITAVHPVYLYTIMVSRPRKKRKTYDKDDIDVRIMENILTSSDELELARSLADFTHRITLPSANYQ